MPVPILVATYTPNSVRPGLATFHVSNLAAFFRGALVVGTATAAPTVYSDLSVLFEMEMEFVASFSWVRNEQGNSISASFELPALSTAGNGLNTWFALFRASTPSVSDEPPVATYGPIVQDVLV